MTQRKTVGSSCPCALSPGQRRQRLLQARESLFPPPAVPSVLWCCVAQMLVFLLGRPLPLPWTTPRSLFSQGHAQFPTSGTAPAHSEQMPELQPGAVALVSGWVLLSCLRIWFTGQRRNARGATPTRFGCGPSHHTVVQP